MPAKRWQRRCTWLAAGALGALLAGIVLLNLWPQEPVPPRVGQVSAVNSAQFQREASALLAAPLSGGNAVTALQNG
ncbi:MAG TPA: cardiolipin synthase B, partial [Rhodanobacter sp.]|nr:cardiolipin synthase B [Rhodanobacter sp.]